jgi:hypothetical protein
MKMVAHEWLRSPCPRGQPWDEATECGAVDGRLGATPAQTATEPIG